MEEEYEKFTATTLIYANGARIRITVAAGTKFCLSNAICNMFHVRFIMSMCTLAMSQTFGWGLGVGL